MESAAPPNVEIVHYKDTQNSFPISRQKEEVLIGLRGESLRPSPQNADLNTKTSLGH